MLINMSKNLWHCARLKFAQFNQDRSVSDFQIIRIGKVEQLAEHDLHDHVLQRDLCLQRIAQELSGAAKE